MKVQCKKCEKVYKQYTEYQIPGCRSKEFDICPYCGNINDSSYDEVYDNYPIEEELNHESTAN